MHAIAQSLPPHVIFLAHVLSTEQSILHFEAVHVMSSPHAPEPEQSTLHCEPAHEIGCVHDAPPVQWMSHAVALVQSIVFVHDSKPQLTLHETPAGHLIASPQSFGPEQLNQHVPSFRHVPPTFGHTDAHSAAASAL